jgi:hypothetical protein
MLSKEHGALKATRHRQLKGHTEAVTGCSLSADGSRALTCSVDRAARLWDLPDGSKELLKLVGHTDWIWGCSLSADGTRALTCSDDQTARLWDLSDGGKELLKLVGHTKTITGCSLSADGTRALTCSVDKTARLWDLSDGGKEPAPGVGMMALSHVAEVKRELLEHDDDKASSRTQGPYAVALAQQATRAAGHAPDDRPAKRRRSGPSSPPAEPRGVQRAAATAAAPAPAPATKGELAALRAQLDAAMQVLGVAQATLASIVARQVA